MKDLMKSYGCIFVAGCLWGTNGLFVKLMQGCGSSSAYTGFVRIALSLLILIVITLVKEGPKAFRISKRTLISCMLLGLVCQALYNYVYSSAINSLGVSFACVMTYMSPAFASVISYFLFREKFGPNKYLAMGLNLVGCFLTVTGGHLSGMSFAVSGLLFGLASAACYSLVGIFGRIASGESSPYVVATYNFLFGTIFLGIFGHPWTTVANPLEPGILLYGLIYALIPTGICYIIYFTGVSRIKESSKVPVVASVENVVAVLIGVLVFHENVGLGNLFGVLLVLFSIVIMNVELPAGRRHAGQRSSVDVQGHVTV
jgi:drug/metabolite transporter (DMT)-like permease